MHYVTDKFVRLGMTKLEFKIEILKAFKNDLNKTITPMLIYRQIHDKYEYLNFHYGDCSNQIHEFLITKVLHTHRIVEQTLDKGKVIKYKLESDTEIQIHKYGIGILINLKKIHFKKNLEKVVKVVQVITLITTSCIGALWATLQILDRIHKCCGCHH